MSNQESGFTFPDTSYDNFKKHTGSFFRKTKDPSCTLESAQAGEKAIGLMWLGRSEWTELQEYESTIILNMVGTRVIDIQVSEMSIEEE